jgi:hypothetical protein
VSGCQTCTGLAQLLGQPAGHNSVVHRWYEERKKKRKTIDAEKLRKLMEEKPQLLQDLSQENPYNPQDFAGV